MSRSYREPYWTDGYGTKRKKVAKKSANKTVRASKEAINGNMYKKLYCSWDICDFKFEDKDNYKVKRK